jgi:glutamate formiminotransferase
MPLIAFNVNLASENLALAKSIAAAVRHSGGGLRHVKAIGIPLKSRNIVQVSMNLTNFRETSILAAFDAVKEQALQNGVSILGSELIGLIPQEALKGISTDALQLTNFSSDCVIETHLDELASEL